MRIPLLVFVLATTSSNILQSSSLQDKRVFLYLLSPLFIVAIIKIFWKNLNLQTKTQILIARLYKLFNNTPNIYIISSNYMIDIPSSMSRLINIWQNLPIIAKDLECAKKHHVVSQSSPGLCLLRTRSPFQTTDCNQVGTMFGKMASDQVNVEPFAWSFRLWYRT